MNISKWYNVQGAKLGIFINGLIINGFVHGLKALSYTLLIIDGVIITSLIFMNLRAVK